MTKYKSDIAESASSMMQLPDTLEGMLRDIHGQTEVTNKQGENKEGNLSITNAVPSQTKKKDKLNVKNQNINDSTIVGDELWTSFCKQCVYEEQLPKTVGKDGVTSFCKIDKDILATFKRYIVEGYSTQTVVNAILRSFILHYKKEFNQYRKVEKPLL
ncbi:MAG: zinc-finger domain-containing protein [Prevotella sp.]|jgi:hypothetical protein|uniref:Uncharacterized protein n=1 Tax=Segatella salivae DSM 15606 TaxID=888832 RepID=E6MTK4_9BACT|nr:zinc-finger domain-containing protein [Segatella salivae]EFV03036.1 hypothetical protein HMPREF9420_2822 [Segatella salivae DSM 15606]MBF1629551.1 zinc-finger domain-containing protein [Prevotella sp.]